jgi:predicted aspartyl protease
MGTARSAFPVTTAPAIDGGGRRTPLRKALLAAALCLAACGSSLAAEQAHCRFVKIGTLAVEPGKNNPYIDGMLNGLPMKVLLDSGSTETSLMRGIAERAHLTLAHTNAVTFGLSGESERYSALVDEVSFGPVRWGHVHLAVVWQSLMGDGLDAVLGADFLFQNDVEMALAEKQIRFFRPEHCEDAFLAYWDKKAAAVKMLATAPDDLRPMVDIEINGKRLKAMIDSGAEMSLVDARAAASVGVVRAPDDRSPPSDMGGLGSHTVQSWVGTFKSVVIGSEEIRNARIDVMDMSGAVLADSARMSTTESMQNEADVLLGADFLMAHRVLFAVSQHLVYFTYLGGPAFERTRKKVEAPRFDIDAAMQIAGSLVTPGTKDFHALNIPAGKDGDEDVARIAKALREGADAHAALAVVGPDAELNYRMLKKALLAAPEQSLTHLLLLFVGNPGQFDELAALAGKAGAEFRAKAGK